MAVIVDVVKPDIDILNLTKNKDYCVINNIFYGNNSQERQFRLFQSLTLLNNPCGSDEEVTDDYLYFLKTVKQLDLQNCKQYDLISKLLPFLQNYYKTRFVVKQNGIKMIDTYPEESKIFVIFGEENDGDYFADDECILDSDHDNYYCSFVMKTSDFERNLEQSHNHQIDLFSVEFFPFNTIKEGNICKMSTYKFSPIKTLQEIQNNLSVSGTNHTDNDFVMKIKKIVRVARNFGYLSNDLPDEFFSDFLSQFYKIFQNEIDLCGFKKFVVGQFKQNLDKHCNPNSLSKKQTNQLTIHEQFLYSNYHTLNQFVISFQTYAHFENNVSLKKTCTTETLTSNRDLVKKYEDRCQDFLMKAVIQNLCLENGDLERIKKLKADNEELRTKAMNVIQMNIDLNQTNTQQAKELDDMKNDNNRIEQITEFQSLECMKLDIESLELKIEKEKKKIIKRKKGKRNTKLDKISKENSDLKNSIEEQNKLIEEKGKQMKVLNTELNRLKEKQVKSEIKKSKNKTADLKDDILKTLKESKQIFALEQKVSESNNKVKSLRNQLNNKNKDNQSKDNDIKKEKEDKHNLKISHEKLIEEKEAKIRHISEMSKKKDQSSLTKQNELKHEISQIKNDAKTKVEESNIKIDRLISEKEKMTEEIITSKDSLQELLEETTGLESQMLKLKEKNKSLSNEITYKDQEIQQQQDVINKKKLEIRKQTKTNENLETNIKLKEQKIEESTAENNKNKEQNFFNSVMATFNSKNALKVFDHKLDFADEKNGKSKFVYLKLKTGIKELHSTVVKLMIESCSKMLSAETTKNEEKIKSKIKAGQRSVAALNVCDGRIKDCFQISAHVQPKSKELFTKILKSIQIFYKIELVNLNRCIQICDKTRSKCSREDKTNQTPNQLKYIVQSHFDGSVERNHNTVKEFKEWLLT